MGSMTLEELMARVDMTKGELKQVLQEHYRDVGLSKEKQESLEGKSLYELKEIYLTSLYEEDDIPF